MQLISVLSWNERMFLQYSCLSKLPTFISFEFETSDSTKITQRRNILLELHQAPHHLILYACMIGTPAIIIFVCKWHTRNGEAKGEIP
jgi:hypothetical protein